MTYFHGFDLALRADDEPDTVGSKPPDTGGDCLPFDHLGSRRFEILTYRIKSAERARPQHTVALMQGAGERGRDVVVRDAAGRVVEIIQCKNLRDRLPEPMARAELLKLALHAFLERAILGEGPVTYELWCPSGFSEPAASFVDAWPTTWVESTLETAAEELFERYSAFCSLTWEAVRDFVLNDFPKVVRVERHEGVDISVQVRRNKQIYQSFFEGRVVLDAGEALTAVEGAVWTAFQKFGDQDAIHVLDRISSFPPEKRLVGPVGYVMGMPIELVSQFRQSEYEEYARCAMQATYGMTLVVQNACARIARELVDDLRPRLNPANPNLFLILLKTFTWSMLAKVNSLPMPSMRDLRPGLEKYREGSLDERLDHHVAQVWDECRRCIDACEIAKPDPGSDADIRAAIAKQALEGFASKEHFQRALTADITRFHREIEEVFGRFMRLIPDELLVITDTVTVFQKKMLFRRMLETTNELTRLRGSAEIPK